MNKKSKFEKLIPSSAWASLPKYKGNEEKFLIEFTKLATSKLYNINYSDESNELIRHLVIGGEISALWEWLDGPELQKNAVEDRAKSMLAAIDLCSLFSKKPESVKTWVRDLKAELYDFNQEEREEILDTRLGKIGQVITHMALLLPAKEAAFIANNIGINIFDIEPKVLSSLLVQTEKSFNDLGNTFDNLGAIGRLLKNPHQLENAKSMRKPTSLQTNAEINKRKYQNRPELSKNAAVAVEKNPY